MRSDNSTAIFYPFCRLILFYGWSSKVSKEIVDKFHKMALKNGAIDEGAPGIREDGNYYGYFRDLDGNKITARCVIT